MVEAKFRSEVTLPAALEFRLFDDVLASVDFKPAFELKVDGKMALKAMLHDQLPNACYHVKLSASNTSNLKIAFNKKKPFEKELYDNSGVLLENENCVINEFKFSKKEYLIKTGQEEPVKLDLSFELDDEQVSPILPATEIQFTSSNDQIAVNSKGVISLKPTARAGAEAEITAMMTIGEKEYKAKTKVKAQAALFRKRYSIAVFAIHYTEL